MATVGDLQSSYKWRSTGQGTEVHIFYQTFQLGPNAGNPDEWKRTEEDQYGRKQEIDAMRLKRFFESNRQNFPGGVNVVCQRLGTFDKTMEKLKEMDDKKQEYERYDCFFFAFLTFSEVDGNLHFNDTTLEKGFVPLENILKAVSQLKVAQEKPKIFLIQGDEMSLSRKKVMTKSPGAEPDSKQAIPDADDYLIIQSNIPQKVALRESFLIQAFVEEMERNFGVVNKLDMFSLTTYIRENVKMKIESKTPAPVRKADLCPPLVTSTLSKKLEWHLNVVQP